MRSLRILRLTGAQPTIAAQVYVFFTVPGTVKLDAVVFDHELKRADSEKWSGGPGRLASRPTVCCFRYVSCG